jgi:hypothetical protein
MTNIKKHKTGIHGHSLNRSIMLHKCLWIVSEGSEEGFVTWKFDLTDSNAVVDTVHIQCSTWLRDTGRVVLKMCSSEMCSLVPGGMTVIDTPFPCNSVRLHF